MKKLFFLFVLFSVLLTVITACTSDDTSTLPQSSGDIPENDITLSGEGTSSSEDPAESGQKPEDTQAPGTEAPVISLSFSKPGGMDSYAVTGIGNLTDTHIEIPATYNGLPVTQIAEKAFYQNTHITSHTLPDSVRSSQGAGRLCLCPLRRAGNGCPAGKHEYRRRRIVFLLFFTEIGYTSSRYSEDWQFLFLLLQEFEQCQFG